VVALVAVASGRAVAQFFVGQSGNVAMESLSARLRRLVAYDMLLRPRGAIIALSRVTALISETFVKSAAFAYAAANLLAAIVQSVALAALMAFVAPRETAASVASLAIVGLGVTALNRRSRAAAERVPVYLHHATELITRIGRNTLLVRALRTERREHASLTHSIDAYERYSIDAAWLGNAATALVPLSGMLLIAAVVTASQRVFGTPGLTLISFLYLLMRFVQSLASAVLQLSQCTRTYPQFREALVYVASVTATGQPDLTRVCERAHAPAQSRVSHTIDEQPAVEQAAVEAPAIELCGVSYRYEAAARDAVSDINLHVKAGTQVAITGPSGAGKSTLLALLLGLVQPARGSITMAGRTPNEWFNDEKIRIGYVGAEPFLFGATIRDNLTYGARDAPNDEALWRGLETVQLASVIMNLPGGLDYVLGDDGSGLSSGQKQRLCLARALANQPHLLILDEVSANLDVETEAHIAQVLRGLRGRCTTVLVTHRPGIMAYADHVLELPASR